MHVYAFLSLALVVSHAMKPEVYWKSIMPNSPMPKAIKDLLYTEASNDGKEKVPVDTTSMNMKLKDQPQQFYIYGASKDNVKDQPQQFYRYGDGVKDQPKQFYFYGASKDNVKDQPQQFYRYGDGVKDQPKQFYIYGASKDNVKDQPQQFYRYGDGVKDQPKQFYIYGASKDKVKDQPQQFYKYEDELALVGSHAMKPEVYWKSVLPNSPMPKAIKELLYTKASNDGKEIVPGDTTSMNMKLKDQPQQFYFYGASKDNVKDQPQQFYRYGDGVKDQPKQFYIYGASKNDVKDQPQQFYRYGDGVKDQPKQFYIYGASKDNVKDQSQQFYRYGDGVKDQPKQFYIYGASKNDVKNQPKQFYFYSDSENQLSKNQLRHDQMVLVNLLFLENDLHQGEELKLHFMKNQYQKTAFLPKNTADSIPFSSKDLPQIYNKFSVNPDSMEAEIMKQTLSLCEYKGIEGEETFCATSLESMIDISTTNLGKKVKALSTEVNAKESTPSQKYKIEFVRKLTADKVMICHSQNYAYAVFYCHITIGTQSYMVSLEGADGTKVKSVAVCHTDTTKWSPKHLAFQVLKVSPGTTVCHFLPEDHVLWVPY